MVEGQPRAGRVRRRRAIGLGTGGRTFDPGGIGRCDHRGRRCARAGHARADPAEFVEQNPNTARALVMAMLDAAKFVDTQGNRAKVAELIANADYVNVPGVYFDGVIAGRFLGNYEDGLGRTWHDINHMKFFNDGKVPFPYLSDGMWFLTQFKRWGAAQARPGLSRRRQTDQPHRAISTGRSAAQRGRARRCDAQLNIDGWHGVGWERC